MVPGITGGRPGNQSLSSWYVPWATVSCFPQISECGSGLAWLKLPVGFSSYIRNITLHAQHITPCHPNIPSLQLSLPEAHVLLNASQRSIPSCPFMDVWVTLPSLAVVVVIAGAGQLNSIMTP